MPIRIGQVRIGPIRLRRLEKNVSRLCGERSFVTVRGAAIAPLLTDVLRRQRLDAIVFYGSPYLWASVREPLLSELPHIFTCAQMPMARNLAMQRLVLTLLGAFPIGGVGD